jgi:WhiB family redox-sensing transcriptional regulator
MLEDLRMQGLCAQTDPELFFPAAAEGTRVGDRRRAEAKRICALCPVISECLAWALGSGEDYGIWGGMTEGERRALLTEKTRLAQPAAHAIDIGIDDNTVQSTTLHGFDCGHVRHIAAERKRVVSVGELHAVWTAAIAGEKGPRFCRVCKPWRDVAGLREDEGLYRQAFVNTATCARCGHRTGGCPRCGERDSALGARIQGVPYCHAPGRPSCYMAQISADAARRAVAS